MKISFQFFTVVLLSFFVISCEKTPLKRTYEEVVINSPLRSLDPRAANPHAFMEMGAGPDAQLNDMLQKSVVDVPLKWTVPPGWQEKRGSGMRLATFVPDKDNSIECSIVTLGGMAGGLEANVIRWMKQINLKEETPQKIQAFLGKQEAFQSQGGLKVRLIDLTQFQTAKDQNENALLGAVVETGDTVFVKMTGTYAAVQANRANFLSLCQSLRLNHE